MARPKVHDAALRERLLRSGTKNLIANNDWNETFWGVSQTRGTNHLGKILMKIRGEAQAGTDVEAWVASAFSLADPSSATLEPLSLEVTKAGAVVEVSQ